MAIETPPSILHALVIVWFIPAFFGRLWLIVYVACGLTLRWANRLDIGFAWFNRHFDVENHLLQCIGLVAGTFMALGYWILAAIHVLPLGAFVFSLSWRSRSPSWCFDAPEENQASFGSGEHREGGLARLTFGKSTHPKFLRPWRRRR